MDTLKSWGINREIAMLGLARGVDSLGTSMLIILIPLMVAERGIGLAGLSTPFVIGILLSVFGVVDSFSQPPVGVYMDRLGIRKPFLLAGLALYAICTASFIWVYSFESMFFLRIVQGLSVALTLPPSMALMTEYSHRTTRGTAMSFYNLMRLVGFSCGPLLAGWMVGFASYTLILSIGAGAGVMGFILVSLLVEEPESIETPREGETVLDAFRGLVSSDVRAFHKLAYANLTMATAISLIASLENEFNHRLGQTPQEFGIAFSALVLTMMIFQIPVGRLADTIGRKYIIVSGLLLLVPVTVFMGHVETTLQFVVARMIQGVGVACVAAPTLALGGDKSSSGKRGREMSLITMAFGLGIGLGPMFGGFLAGQFTFQTPFYLGAVLVLSSALVVSTSVDESKLVEPADIVTQEPD
jgi:MFS family permease